MAGLFLSHASQDKPIVYRLAFDLAIRGFPVWFDVWDIRMGHSLTETIKAGIDNSDYVLVVISNNTQLSSHWVQAEIEQAIELERSSGRTIIIPIKLDTAVPPEQLRDRVYADFSESYHAGLERLSAELRNLNIHRVAIPLSRRVIPLRIREGNLLQKSAFTQAVNAARDSYQPGQELLAGQLRLSPDDEYLIERERMLRRMDAGDLSPEREDYVNELSGELAHDEAALFNGIALMINGVGLTDSFIDVTEAAHWFCKLIRTPMIKIVKRINDWVDAPSGARIPRFQLGVDMLEDIYDCAQLDTVDIGPRGEEDFGMDTGFALHTDPALGIERRLISWMQEYRVVGQEPLKEHLDWPVISKWVVPQHLYRVLLLEQEFPITWTYDDWLIGLH